MSVLRKDLVKLFLDKPEIKLENNSEGIHYLFGIYGSLLMHFVAYFLFLENLDF